MDQTSKTTGQIFSSVLSFKLARNTTYLIFGQLIAQASTALVGIIIARETSQAGYGLYTLAASFSVALGTLFGMGSDSIIVREAAQYPGQVRNTYNAGFWLRMVCFPISILISLLIARLGGFESQQFVIILLGMLIFGLSSAAELPRSIFIGLQQMKSDLVSRVSEKMVVLLVVVILVLALGVVKLPMIMIGILIATLVGIIPSWWMLKGQVTIIPNTHLKQNSWIWRASAPLAASILLISVYIQLPVILLSRFSSIETVGLYNAALNTVIPFTLISVALTSAMLPLLSNIFRTNKPAFSRTFSQFFILSLVLSLPLAVMIQLFGEDLLIFLFGDAFLPATELIALFAWYLPTVFINMYLLNVMISIGAQGLSAWLNLISLFVTILVGFILIPRAGAVGAAFTVLFTALFSIIIKIVLLWAKIRPQYYFRILFVLIIGAGMLIAGSPGVIQSQVLQIGISLILFFIILVVSGILNFRIARSIYHPL